MIRRIVVGFALVSLAVAPLFAGLSSKYKEWPSTPQGYFMTQAERTAWAGIQTDADAQKFIDHFLSLRGGEFPAEVVKRAEMADKYLTIGKTLGSKTLRGKTIILLGPPAAMEVADSVGGEGSRNAGVAELPKTSAGSEDGLGSTGGSMRGGTSGMRAGDDVRSSVTNLSTMRVTRTYTFTFRNDIAKHLDKKEIVIFVAADANTGHDQLSSQSAAADVEKIFEAAAQASIVKPKQ